MSKIATIFYSLMLITTIVASASLKSMELVTIPLDHEHQEALQEFAATFMPLFAKNISQFNELGDIMTPRN